jgi:hypothetical protein
MRHADVGRIDVTVDVEIGDVAMFLFADVVGEPADGEQVRRTIEFNAIFKREALIRENSIRDGSQLRVGENQVAQEFQLSPLLFYDSNKLDAGCLAIATAMIRGESFERFKLSKAPQRLPRRAGMKY